MEKYITLLGTEDVQRAARNIQDAATDISNAVANFEDSLNRQRIFLDEWLGRLEDIMKKPTHLHRGPR